MWPDKHLRGWAPLPGLDAGQHEAYETIHNLTKGLIMRELAHGAEAQLVVLLREQNPEFMDMLFDRMVSNGAVYTYAYIIAHFVGRGLNRNQAVALATMLLT